MVLTIAAPAKVSLKRALAEGAYLLHLYFPLLLKSGDRTLFIQLRLQSFW